MKITFIQTGGTIDKDYPQTVKSYAFEISESAVKRIFKKMNPAFEYEIISVLKKDSLDITGKNRDRIYDAIKKIKNDKIIITHGTDTMNETAKRLSQIKDKTIILTGAMIPERFKETDADFNVGCAVGAINVLSPGVYIAMNGRIYKWNECKKLDSGNFVKK